MSTKFVRRAKPTDSAGAAGSSGPRDSGSAPGTRAWVNGSVLTSTGVDSIDQALGAGPGVPLESFLLVGQDKHSRFYTSVLRCLAAEGVTSGQRVCVVAGDHWLQSKQAEKFWSNLPSKNRRNAKKEASSGSSGAVTAEKPDLKIAWRYEQYLGDGKSAGTSSSKEIGLSSMSTSPFYLDFRKPVPEEAVKKFSVTVRLPSKSVGEKAFIEEVVKSVKDVLEQSQKSGEAVRFIFPEFGNYVEYPNSFKTLLHLVRHLKVSAQLSSRHVFLFTAPEYLFSSEENLALARLFDSYMTMKSFSTEDEHKTYGDDIDGFLFVHKTLRPNSFVEFQVPDTNMYLFKQSKKEFCIERASLPPEESRTGGAPTSATESKSASIPKSIEF